MNNHYGLVLCGGSGTRLWPLSRTQKPKQLLALNGDETLLQQTVTRLARYIQPSQLFTVTHEDHKFEVKGQLAELYPDALPNVIAEPIAKNTLPAIAWATYKIFQQNPEAIIGVFASDHAINDDDAFVSAWQTAERIAQDGYLVLLGIQPNEPATGYGYIKPSDNLISHDSVATQDVFEVAAFVEKPSAEKAIKFIAEGYLWNSGMFVFKAANFLQFLNQYQPEIYANLTQQDIVTAYNRFPNISMDYGLAEVLVAHHEKVAVVPVSMQWSDLGSWDSIYQHQIKDANNNAVHGDVIANETSNSLLWSECGLLATLGVDNLAVIQTVDATLICDKNRTEDIKQLVNLVKNHKPALTEIHQTVQRPWGSYTVLEESACFKIKRIVVNPGAKLSMQLHKYRSEHWVVVSGIATITNGELKIILNENESTYIPKMHQHRLENAHHQPLSIIEVQCGEYVGEDDIVRFDDQYGRADEVSVKKR